MDRSVLVSTLWARGLLGTVGPLTSQKVGIVLADLVTESGSDRTVLWTVLVVDPSVALLRLFLLKEHGRPGRSLLLIREEMVLLGSIALVTQLVCEMLLTLFLKWLMSPLASLYSDRAC